MVNFNEYKFNKKEELLFFSGLIFLGIIVSILLYRNILFSIIILPFYKKIHDYLIDEIVAKRKQRYLLQFKDFLFMTSTAIGAGRSMKDAIYESIPGLKEIHGEKSLLPIELEKVYERMEIGGENDVDVLMDLAVCSGSSDVIDFVTIYSICKTTGASLILALNRAASVIIDKMTIEREIKEIVNRKEREGIIIFLMPIVIILFLNLCAPDYIAPLYQTLAGRVIMTIVLVSNIAIFGLIKRIVKVEI